MKKPAPGFTDKHSLQSKPAAPPSSGPKLRIGKEIADTTWRMTVPVVLFAFIGIYADLKLQSKPWITLLGVIVGFVFAAILIKKQIAASQDTNE